MLFILALAVSIRIAWDIGMPTSSSINWNVLVQIDLYRSISVRNH